MEIIRDFSDAKLNNDGKAVALGNFDGMHRGHQAVIAATMNSGFLPAAFTFSSNPHEAERIVTKEEKVEIFEKLGVQYLLIADFERIRNMTAEDFFSDVLIGRLKAKKICCGEDFRFGKRAEGDVALLRELCEREGITLEVVQPVMFGGEPISSTRIRQALKNGNLTEANAMLGREFGFSLEVIHGNHIGTGLGMPTINQALPEGFILPKFGVYASFAEVNGELFFGVTNIGVKPTVGSDRVLSETWMPDFSGDLYGKRVRLYLISFIRAERKFASLEEMKNEVMKNAETAKEITAEYQWIQPNKWLK